MRAGASQRAAKCRCCRECEHTTNKSIGESAIDPGTWASLSETRKAGRRPAVIVKPRLPARIPSRGCVAARFQRPFLNGRFSMSRSVLYVVLAVLVAAVLGAGGYLIASGNQASSATAAGCCCDGGCPLCDCSSCADCPCGAACCTGGECCGEGSDCCGATAASPKSACCAK